jgi:glycopeptide antibiotics resistance protein
MNFQSIATMTLRAAGFGAIICGVYALIRRMRGRPLSAGRLLPVFYLAALMEITVLRGGIGWSALFTAQRLPVHWIPFETTLDQWRIGAGAFIYHVGGNLAWFVPLGVILRKKSVWIALLAGVVVSAGIECMQWVLVSGMTDIDDVILNACGTLAGYWLARGMRGRGKRTGGDTPE